MWEIRARESIHMFWLFENFDYYNRQFAIYLNNYILNCLTVQNDLRIMTLPAHHTENWSQCGSNTTVHLIRPCRALSKRHISTIHIPIGNNNQPAVPPNPHHHASQPTHSININLIPPAGWVLWASPVGTCSRFMRVRRSRQHQRYWPAAFSVFLYQIRILNAGWYLDFKRWIVSLPVGGNSVRRCLYTSGVASSIIVI